MPTLKTEAGQAVDVTPVDAEAINAQFDQTMNDDGQDESALPKRTRREPAADGEPKPRRIRQQKEEKSRTVAKPAVVLDGDARRMGVRGVVQVVAVIPIAVYKATSDLAYLADATTVASSADEWAEACATTADADPRFAAVLDKVCSAGPYAALIAVALKVGSQLARNHKPSLALPGTVDPMELLTAPETAATAA